VNRCTIEGCRRRHWARGWCREHYNRWYRAGDPLAPPKQPRPAPATARIRAGESSWAPTPLAALPTYPRHVGAALHALAESNPSPAEYEAEKARILGGQT